MGNKNILVYNEQNCPAESKPILEQIRSAYGFIPNLMGIMAVSPAVLNAYKTLSSIFEETSFTAVERQIVLMTVSYKNNCNYCMAAHSTISKMQKIDPDIIDKLRTGQEITDLKLESLRRFTISVLETNGYPNQVEIDKFLAVGYTSASIFELVLGIGLKTISNYINHISETPIDQNFQSEIWSRNNSN